MKERDSSAEFIAHVKQEKNGTWTTQSLADHLNGTASRAAEFAAVFGNADWGELLGYWHDVGKYLPSWQKHIRRESGYNDGAFLEADSGKVNHSTAGASHAYDRFREPVSRILCYPIAGHHAGLPDWEPDSVGGALVSRLFSEPLGQVLDCNELEQIRSIPEARHFLDRLPPKSQPMRISDSQQAREVREHLHLWVRMLYSCLVDADFLDTEAFMQPDQARDRGGYPSLAELKARFDIYMKRKKDEASANVLNARREEVLEACRAKARLPQGVFSLNVPTGGGKTLSAMAFALEHALAHGLKRVVMAIPYTSIIEQTARVYREVFGDDSIVEHNSNLEPEKETVASRLASENWDAPIVVTTNVQLFESLFAARSSACRKNHNLASSVIILDEAQMLPPEYLRALLSVLRGLSECFGVTEVLCTATQPALVGRIGSGQAEMVGLSAVTPIVDEPHRLAVELRRVAFHFPKDDVPETWEAIATRLQQCKQVLCIVNTKRSCRELHALMPPGTLHLSGFMCPEERSEIIAEIRDLLARRKMVRVVSTQLVEAGVDVDFPVVFRAMAGLDSVAQAAGRCNREMLLNAAGRMGEVFVFNPPRLSPSGLLRKGEDAFRSLLRTNPCLDPNTDAYTDYFRRFFTSANTFDKPRFEERILRENAAAKYQFRSLASQFHLVDDQAQAAVVVRYRGRAASSEPLIERLLEGQIDRDLLRRLQRFSISVPTRLLATLVEKGMVAERDGFYVQVSPELYTPGVGLEVDAEWAPESLMI